MAWEFAKLWNLQHWCTCAVGMRELGNHDNGASDVFGFNSVLKDFPRKSQNKIFPPKEL